MFFEGNANDEDQVIGRKVEQVKVAIGELLQRGWVVRKRGRGTFVSRSRNDSPNGERADYKAIGVLVRDIASVDDVYPEIIRGIQDVCTSRDYHVIVGNTDSRLEGISNGIDRFLKAGVAGVIISPAIHPLGWTSSQMTSSSEHRHRIYHRLVEAGVPLVLVNREIPGVDVSCVMSDNELGGYMACKHLIEQGHKRIAAIFPPLYSTVRAREQGYKRALTEAGIAPTDALVQYACLDDPAPVRTMMESLFALKEPPSAIFAFTDDYAAQAFAALYERGLKVPDDVAIVGYNDCRLALSLPVALTSVAYPKYEIGQRAAQLLLQSMSDPTTKETVVLPPELVVRASSSKSPSEVNVT